MKQKLLQAMVVLLACLGAHAQVNSGSNGSDGAFNPTTNIVINMADHPDGIYQYTSVNIPAGVTVSFIPNSGNKPVVWLVQGTCVISGSVNLSGASGSGGTGGGSGGAGGPGGWKGGSAGSPISQPGQGPGGGTGNNDTVFPPASVYAGGGSFGIQGGGTTPGVVYGNAFLLPLLGGSGGGGRYYQNPYVGGNVFDGGGGGGGGLLIAASTSVTLTGSINAIGGSTGSGLPGWGLGGGGSGGGIRIVTPRLSGNGSISARSGSNGGTGRIRLDIFENTFAGTTLGNTTEGFQPIILPVSGQGIQLGITSIAGVAVAANPSGVLANPDAIVPAQQNNPIPIVVHCLNIPLNTQITVSVRPANGATVSATGLNNTGTLASSTATISITMPRGGGIIYATAATGN